MAKKLNRVSLSRRKIAAAAAVAFTGVSLYGAGSVSAQSTFNWTGGTAGTASLWGTTTNWTQGIAPGSKTLTTNNDIGIFGSAGTSTTIQFNFSTIGTPYYIGEIQLTAADTVARTFGSNSTTAGTLVLNGTGANSLILENLSAVAMTLAPQSGGGTGPMTVKLVAANSTINNNGAVTISANLTETTAGSGFTKTGTGLLTLSGTNSFTGNMFINGGGFSIVSQAQIGNGNISFGLGAGTAAILSSAAPLTVANTAAVTLTNNIALPAPASASTYTILKNTASTTAGTQLNLMGNITGGSAFATLFLNSSITLDTTTTYRLAGVNTFRGTVNVNRGGIIVASATGLGDVANVIQLASNNNTTLGDLRFELGGTFANPIQFMSTSGINTAGNVVNLSGPLSGPTAWRVIGSAGGTLVLTGTGSTNAGLITVASGTLQVGNNGTTGTLGTAGVSVGTTLVFNRSDDVTFSNVLSGAGSIVQSGVNNLTLSAANAFTGSYFINAGTLTFSNTNTGATAIAASGTKLAFTSSGTLGTAIINSGGQLDVTPAGTPYTFAGGQNLVVGRTGAAATDVIGDVIVSSSLNIGTVGAARTATFLNNLTLNAGTTLFDLSGAATTVGSGINDLVAVGGNLSLINTNPIAITAPAGLTTGSYTLFTYGGTLTGGAANLSIAGVAGGTTRQTITFDTTTTPGAVLLTVAGARADLTWVGNAANNVWDVVTTANFTGAPGPTPDNRFYNLDTVTFDGTGVGNPTPVTIDTIVTPGAVTVGGALNYTFSGLGAIAGTGSLTKSGPGVLTLSLANTYSGGTFITGGTLVANNATASATGPGTVTVSSGAFLQIGAGGTAGNVTGTIVDNGTLVFNRSDALNWIAILSGTGGVTQVGPGALTLSAANTYQGPTVVTSSILSIATDANIGTPPASPTPGSLVLNNGTLTTAGLTLSANRGLSLGPVTGSGSGTIDSAGTVTYGGIITNNGGTGSLVKTGVGTLVLSGASPSTYSGGTLLTGGTISIANGGALGTGPLTIGIGATTGTGATANTTGALVVNNTAAVTLPNNLVLPQPAAVTVYSIFKTAVSSSTGTLLDLTGTISGGNANLTFVLNTGTSSDNTTTFRFPGTNTFTGTVNLNRGGIIVVNAASLGAATNPVVLNGNVNTTLGDLRFENAMTFANPIQLLAVSTSPISTNGNDVVSTGVISGASTAGLYKVGLGTLTLQGANTYSGVTTIAQGILAASNIVTGATSNLGSATTAILLGVATTEGTLSYTGNSASYTRGFTVAAGGGKVLVANAGQTLTVATGAVAIAGPLTFGGNGDTLVSSVISSTGSLVKIGNTTLTLTGINTFAGGTTLSAGVILANNATNSLGAGPVNVNAGTLAGNGKIANSGGVTNQLFVNNGGTISPGGTGNGTSIVSTLTTGDQTWKGGGTYALDLNAIASTGKTPGTDWDYLELGTTNLTLNTIGEGGTGTFNLVINPLAGDVANGALMTIAHAGTLNALTAASSVAYINSHQSDFTLTTINNSTPFQISAALNATAGFDLQISPVPEPTSASLLAIGAVGLLARRRRGKANAVR